MPFKFMRVLRSTVYEFIRYIYLDNSNTYIYIIYIMHGLYFFGVRVLTFKVNEDGKISI